MSYLSRPLITLLIGAAVDLAIARGWLLPQEKAVWVQGALQVVGAAGTASLVCISLWHEYVKMHNQIPTQVQVTTDRKTGLLQLFKDFVLIKKQVEQPVAETNPES